MDTTRTPRPVALIILDGYGHNPDSDHNAVAAARTPSFIPMVLTWGSPKAKWVTRKSGI